VPSRLAMIDRGPNERNRDIHGDLRARVGHRHGQTVLPEENEMPYLIVRHKVKDFATWKPVFDEHGALRKANGSKGGLLLRNADDPDEVVVFLE